MRHRPIIFRAWDLADKHWDVPKTEYSRDQGARRYFDSQGSFIRFNRGDIALMQFTGVKDRNGIEIYEGDVVQRYPKDKYNAFVVEWSLDEGWGLPTFIPPETTLIDFEIIGNIYENPDLIPPDY